MPYGKKKERSEHAIAFAKTEAFAADCEILAHFAPKPHYLLALFRRRIQYSHTITSDTGPGYGRDKQPQPVRSILCSIRTSFGAFSMANGALRTYKVECYPGYWIVWHGNVFRTVSSATDLILTLKSSDGLSAKPAPAKSSPRKETVAEFCARTGKTIEQIRSETKAENEARIAKDREMDFDSLFGDLSEHSTYKPGVPVFPSVTAHKRNR